MTIDHSQNPPCFRDNLQQFQSPFKMSQDKLLITRLKVKFHQSMKINELKIPSVSFN